MKQRTVSCVQASITDYQQISSNEVYYIYFRIAFHLRGLMQYATINFHKYKIMFKHAILMFKITHLHSDYLAVSAGFHISVVYTTLIIEQVQNSICNMQKLSFITTKICIKHVIIMT